MRKDGTELTARKLRAWLRDTTEGRQLLEKEAERRCLNCEKVREFETRCLGCERRQAVLLVYGMDADGPAWCEVYTEKWMDVFSVQRVTVEAAEELLAERHLEARMSLRAKELFFPVKRRMSLTILPWSAEDALAGLDRADWYRAVDEVAKRIRKG